MQYTNLVVRSARRIRLLFSSPLAGAAFGQGAVVSAYYAVTSTNASNVSPGIAAAIPIPSAPANVELALTADLTMGGAYTVTVTGVPGQDATLASGTDAFVFGALAAPSLNIEQPQVDLAALVYGTDLVWNGADFQETSSGDLAQVSGNPNVQGALQRRLLDRAGIPWDPTYGAKSDQYVNGPAPNGLSLVASLRRQAVADNRVQSATVTWLNNPESPGDNYFPVVIYFRGATAGQGFTINVNPSGTT